MGLQLVIKARARRGILLYVNDFLYATLSLLLLLSSPACVSFAMINGPNRDSAKVYKLLTGW